MFTETDACLRKQARRKLRGFGFAYIDEFRPAMVITPDAVAGREV